MTKGKTVYWKQGRKTMEGIVEQVIGSMVYIKVKNRYSWMVKKERLVS